MSLFAPALGIHISAGSISISIYLANKNTDCTKSSQIALAAKTAFLRGVQCAFFVDRS